MKKNSTLKALIRGGIGLLCCVSLAFPVGAEPAEDARVLDGGTLCTFGDSLTAMSGWPQDVATQLNMHLVNSGVGGNTTADALKRFDSDVAAKDPDIVLIAFGTNDFVRESAKGSRLSTDQFRENLETIAEKVQALGADPILMTCPYLRESVYVERYYQEDGGVLAVLDTYNEVIRQTASDLGIGLVDIRKACEDYEPSLFLRSDGVHLSDTGDQVYTEEITRYMTSVYRQDPDAPRVTQPTRPAALEGAVTQDLISFDPGNWTTANEGEMTFKQNEDGSLALSNTTGLWPDARYAPEGGLTVPVKGTRLEYDFSTAGAGTSIALYFNGSTPGLVDENESLVLTPYIEGVEREPVSGDILKNQDASGSILLSDLPIPAECIEDGAVWISGVQIYVAGAKNQPVTVRKLSVTTDGSYVAPTTQTEADATTPSASVAPEGDRQLTPILCLIAGAVLAAGLIVVVAVFLYRRNRRRNGASVSSDDPPSSPDQP